MLTATPLGDMLILSSTMVRSLYYKGEPLMVCPMRYYLETLIGSVERKIPREEYKNPMLLGQYFETRCLGSGRQGHMVSELKRKPVSKDVQRLWKKECLKAEMENRQLPPQPIGVKYRYHEHIDHQVQQFDILRKQYGMHIVQNYNTQIRIYKRHPDFNHVLLRCDLDLVTPIVFIRPHDRTGKKENMALIDLKLTNSIENTYTNNGAIPWGDAKRLDVTQLMFYHWMVQDIDFELNKTLNPEGYNALRSFFKPIQDIINSNNLLLLYWVFDYGKDVLQNKFVDVNPNIGKQRELREVVRKTIRRIEEMSEEGFCTMPNDSLCNRCGYSSCHDRLEYESV